MIVTEIVTVEEEQKKHIYSDAGVYICGGVYPWVHAEVFDSIDSEYEYTETNTTIGKEIFVVDYASAYRIMTGGLIMNDIIERATALRQMILKASVSLTDTDAIQAVELFPVWATDTAYEVGDRVSYDGTLYKARQAHTSQSIYPPNIVPALWEVVAPEGKGDSPDNPIEYDQSMAIEKGKFYIENDVIYLCIRDSGVPLYTALANVIGNYVEAYVG